MTLVAAETRIDIGHPGNCCAAVAAFMRHKRGEIKRPDTRSIWEPPSSGLSNQNPATRARPMPSVLSLELISRFAAIVGPANALTDATAIAPHIVEWRGLWHGTSPLVLKPKSTAEVAAILKL